MEREGDEESQSIMRSPSIDEEKRLGSPCGSDDIMNPWLEAQRQKKRVVQTEMVQLGSWSKLRDETRHLGRELGCIEGFIFGIIPCCGALTVFLFAKTAIQPFWVQRSLPEAELGIWFTVSNSCQLIAIFAAPSRRATLLVTGIALAMIIVGTCLIDAKPRAIYLFASAGVFEPLSAALLRLRDAKLESHHFDKTSELMFSCLMLGLLVSSSGGTVFKLFGAQVIGFASCCTAAAVVTTHIHFYFSENVPSLTSSKSYGALPIDKLDEQDKDMNSTHSSTNGATHHQSIIQGKRMMRLMAGIMFGVGITDSMVTTVAPLYFELDLDQPPWTLFGVWVLAFILSTFQASFWTYCGVSFSPQTNNLALLLASSLFTLMATLEASRPLASFVLLAYTLCMNFPHCTSMRVVESYSSSKTVFDKYAVSQRICYTLGLLCGSAAGPSLYFATRQPRIVFMFLSLFLAAMTAIAGFLFFDNVVHIGTEQLLRLVDLEDAFHDTIRRVRVDARRRKLRRKYKLDAKNKATAKSTTFATPNQDEVPTSPAIQQTPSGGKSSALRSALMANSARSSDDEDDDEADPLPGEEDETPLSPRRKYLYSHDDKRRSIMTLVRDIKKVGGSPTPPRPQPSSSKKRKSTPQRSVTSMSL